MMKIIQTDDLKCTDLPKEKAKWEDIIKLASSFDVMLECKSGVRIINLTHLGKTSSIKEIRAALYSEWRKHNHLSSDPEWKILEEIWQAIELLRSKLKDKN